MYIRNGRIPLQLMVKLLQYYHDTTNIDKTFQLFDTMIRFRTLSLQNVNRNRSGENANDIVLTHWESQLLNEEKLPIFMKIIYDYFYSFTMNDIDGDEINKSLLMNYRNKGETICKYINYNISNQKTPNASLYLCGIDYLIGDINTANTKIINIIEKCFNFIDSNDEQQINQCSLLKQWENGQFVLNLSKSLNLPNIINIPLILSSLIFYAKTIPKQDKSLKSLKIKIDIDKFEQFKVLFHYLSINYSPNIEYKIIGKLSNFMIVIELDLDSLLKWCQHHNMISFHDTNKLQMFKQACYDLLPQITFNKTNNNKKKLFANLNATIYK